MVLEIENPAGREPEGLVLGGRASRCVRQPRIAQIPFGCDTDVTQAGTSVTGPTGSITPRPASSLSKGEMWFLC